MRRSYSSEKYGLPRTFFTNWPYNGHRINVLSNTGTIVDDRLRVHINIICKRQHCSLDVTFRATFPADESRYERMAALSKLLILHHTRHPCPYDGEKIRLPEDLNTSSK